MENFGFTFLTIHVIQILFSCCVLSLPSNIRIAAIFDREGDVKHEVAFTAAIDDINNINNWILPGIILEPEIVKIPYGDR